VLEPLSVGLLHMEIALVGLLGQLSLSGELGQ